jgi:tetratricopeptide (TPR) repeat protein
LAIAYVRADKVEELNKFLRKIEITVTPVETQELYLLVGKEFLLKGDKTKAHEYFDKIINSEKEIFDSKILSEALFYKEEYSNALPILKEIHRKNPDDIDVLAKLAICYFKLGNAIEADKNINSLENLRGDYQYGSVDYALAQYYAATENKSLFYKHLLKTAAAGHKYQWQFYKNDPLFLKYINSKEFKEVMDFWK